jgi:DNA replicative helicase MCM subunit Mcm2 (Cdc46/Mcm family)
MNQPIDMLCNEGCQKEFKITKLRTTKVKGGIDKYYFRCPHCKHAYVAYYSSAETVKLQKEVRKHRQSISKLPPDKNAYEEFWNKADELKASIKQSMEEAKRIAEG